MIYAVMRWIMRTLVHVVLAGIWTIKGLDNVPREGAVLICCNHVSTLDPPLLPAFVPRNDSWSMAKAEYFEGSALKRWVFVSFHSFPVVRHSADRAAIKRATTILREGQVLFLYPEGTRIVSGGLHRGEPGAGFLATLTGATVVPAAIVGSREVFGKGFKLPRRSPLLLQFGRPFKVPGRRADGSKVDHQEAVDAIMLAVAELLPPEMRGVYSDLEGWKARVGDLRRPV